MSEIFDRGNHGEQRLAEYLRSSGRVVTRSDRKTFDLIVDGRYAEVKSSARPYGQLQFIGLSDNQMRALQDGEDFILFLVCNVSVPGDEEVIEIDSRMLLSESPTVACTHYWYRPQLDRIRAQSQRERYGASPSG